MKDSILEQFRECAIWARNFVGNRIGNIAGTVAEGLADLADEIDSIEIGGTQLLKNTNVEGIYSSAHGWSLFGDNGTAARNNISVSDAPNKGVIYGVSIAPTDTSHTYAAIFQRVPMYAGTNYTVSCYARGTGVISLRFVYPKSATANSTYKNKTYALNGNWARYSFTILADINLSGVAFGVDTGGDIEMCGFKLETGTKPTDWSPAPEDMDSAISFAISTAASDATTKANNALSGAKSYTDAEIAGMQIGSRNILLNSGDMVSMTDYMINQYSVAQNIAAETKYTIVVKANLPKNHRLDLYLGQTSQNSQGFNGTGKAEIYYAQFTTPSNDLAGQWVRFYNRDMASGGNGNDDGSTGIIHWACLYEGHVKPPVDWTPAPEDTEVPRATAITIPASGWSSDSTAGYPKYYDIAVSGITANDRASITIARASLATAKACGMCPSNETLAGKIRIRAARVPTAAITAQYWIEKGKE